MDRNAAHIFAISAISVIVFLSTGQVAAAQEQGGVHPQLDSTFTVDIGLFYPDREARLRANGSTGSIIGPAPYVDFASELKLGQSDETFAAEFGWKFGKRWSFLMQYFDSRGEGRVTLQEEVEWNDVIFLTGTNVAAGSGFELTRFYFGYSFDINPTFDFGVGGGIHWLHIDAFIEGTAETNLGTEFVREAVSVDAPLPNIGIWYNHHTRYWEWAQYEMGISQPRRLLRCQHISV